MNTALFAEQTAFDILCMPSPEKEISGVYIGDLLSWVMGRADTGDAWITIMSNINIVAVASLTDVALILLADGVIPEADIIATAKDKGINIFSTSLTAYEAAIKISDILK